MLKPYTILEIADEKGSFAGRILADMGANVIKVEPPGGSTERRIGPFYKDIPDPERSLHWFFCNASKKGITLDIEKIRGKEIFIELVKSADIVIESFTPGYLDDLGLGYETLKGINPGIVMMSISNYGQKGPYSRFKASSLVSFGMSSWMHHIGDPDRAPLHISLSQTYFLVGGQAAAGALIALYYRERTGIGQQVDVSAQFPFFMCNFPSVLAFWSLEQREAKRVGQYRQATSAFIRQRQIWECKDGHVAFFLGGGALGERLVGTLVDWMEEEGHDTEILKGIEWGKLDMASIDADFFDEVQDNVGNFFKAFTRDELFDEAVRRRIMLYPVNGASDVARSPQLEARNFWAEVEHEELDLNLKYPGPVAKVSKHSPALRRRAPKTGEHNMEIYEKMLGLSRQEVLCLNMEGVI